MASPVWKPLRELADHEARADLCHRFSRINWFGCSPRATDVNEVQGACAQKDFVVKNSLDQLFSSINATAPLKGEDAMKAAARELRVLYAEERFLRDKISRLEAKVGDADGSESISQSMVEQHWSATPHTNGAQ